MESDYILITAGSYSGKSKRGLELIKKQIGTEMEKVIMVYKTDHQHSYASRDTIGVATNFQNAFFIAKKHAEVNNQVISQEQNINLVNLNQTQGMDEWEYVFEELQTNKLI